MERPRSCPQLAGKGDSRPLKVVHEEFPQCLLSSGLNRTLTHLPTATRGDSCKHHGCCLPCLRGLLNWSGMNCQPQFSL